MRVLAQAPLQHFGDGRGGLHAVTLALDPVEATECCDPNNPITVPALMKAAFSAFKVEYSDASQSLG